MRSERLTGPNVAVAMAWLSLLLLAPLCLSRRSKKPFSPGLPRVKTGDEPHYLVLSNGVTSDGDFELANNYRDVHRSGPQAGRIFAGTPLDHHVAWYQDGHLAFNAIAAFGCDYVLVKDPLDVLCGAVSRF
jgi:hypothetical protein